MVAEPHDGAPLVLAMDMSGGEVAATTTTSGASEGGWKDRDPPPAFDGNEESFKQFLRDLELWRHETDIPKAKHGEAT